MRQVRIIPAAELQHGLDEAEIIRAVEMGLADLAEGGISAPLPGLFASEDPPSDCHIKFAQSLKLGLTTIKVATGYYRNAELGVPVNDGLISVFSAATGQALCVIDDRGWLTGIRTGAIGVIASRMGRQGPSDSVGIIGTGDQAFLQASWAARHTTDRPINLFGRSATKTRRLFDRLRQQGVETSIHDSVDALAASSDIIICCTSSSAPVLFGRHLRPGHHIVSLGADGPGKAELDIESYRLASSVAVDDLDQAKRRSDFGAAMNAGAVHESSVRWFGRCLADGHSLRRHATDITVINLCGSAACDLAVIACFMGSEAGARDRLD